MNSFKSIFVFENGFSIYNKQNRFSYTTYGFSYTSDDILFTTRFNHFRINKNILTSPLNMRSHTHIDTIREKNIS